MLAQVSVCIYGCFPRAQHLRWASAKKGTKWSTRCWQNNNSCKIKTQKKQFLKCQQQISFDAIGSCSSAVSAARGLWISCCMFHLERSFSVIWHLFNICSPAVSRQRGLYSAQHLERQVDRLRRDRIHVVHKAIRLWPEGQRKVWNGDQGMTNCGQIKTPVIEVWIRCGERLEENFKFREAGSHPILTNTPRGVCFMAAADASTSTNYQSFWSFFFPFCKNLHRFW